MSAARSAILASIRRALGQESGTDAAVEDRIKRHPRGIVPDRVDRDRAELAALFVTMATEVSATVRPIASVRDVPDAVVDYLAENNLPAAVRVAPDPELSSIDWSRRPTLTVAVGRADDDDLTSVTGALAGIAETGTLMLASGSGRPTTLNFMPDNHIVVLRVGRIVGPYEDAWDLLRQEGAMPRTINLITGPSRTGDIEQKIQLGAHGPRRLHILLVGSNGH